jgi:hypothetical protein
MKSKFIDGFQPSTNGFSFSNSFTQGTPVLLITTPFGRIPIGNAGGGLCGGMVFASIDFFMSGADANSVKSEEIVPYLCRRLLDSFNFPFGILRYYDWQRRSDTNLVISGIRWQVGVLTLTVETEWPKIRSTLDSGQLAPLGVVKTRSFLPSKLGGNHQVLAYGYDFEEMDGRITMYIYDPNYPGNDDVRLRFSYINTEQGNRIIHSIEGDVVRGVFLTSYRFPECSAVPRPEELNKARSAQREKTDRSR